MVAEIALIAGTSIVGAISAAAINKLSKTRAAQKKKSYMVSPSAARVELISLLFEKSLASEAITRVYEAAQESKIDRLERDRLLLKYKQQLDSLDQRIVHLRPLADYADLTELRNNLATFLEERISSLDQKLLGLSKSGITQDTVEARVHKIIAEATKVQAHPDVEQEQTSEEKSIEQLQSEIMNALQRLEQAEIDKD
jgi:hypothetical protein